MLKNYLKIAFRNIRKNPAYSFINIFGLALGMGVAILILLYVQDELSYDTYHKKSDRIVRVSREWFNDDGKTSLHLGHVAPPFGPLLQQDFPQVQEAVRFFQVNPLIKSNDKSFVEDRFFFADSNVFKVFSWKMLKGDPATALTYPDGIVLTKSTAKKYFGSQNPMGKTLQFEYRGVTFPFQVKGVMQDVPKNSHFHFDFLAAMDPVIKFYGGQKQFMQNYGSNNFATYLLLPKGYDYHKLQKQFPDFIDRHLGTNDQGEKASEGTQLDLMPLTDIHLHSHLDSEIEANGSIENIYIYSAIAFFILLIACINFMNLSTARSAKRAVEVGLRKVIGADRGALIRQFIGESVLLSLCGLIGAVLLVELALPYFNDFVDKSLHLGYLQNGSHLLGLIGIALFVGLVAGSYPAFFLSGFEPASVLKGSYKTGGIHRRFRSVLVVLQFTISIALIVCMGVVYNQLDYMQNKDLGFDKENIVVLPASNNITSNYENVRKQLLKNPGIINVSEQSRVPSGRLLDSQGGAAEVNGQLQDLKVRVADIHVSYHFMDTFGIKLIAGRNFNFELASDSLHSFILNRAAVEAIGWSSPEEAINKEFNYGGRRGKIIGVTTNFNFESLHQKIAPIVFMIPKDRISNVAIKFREGMREEVLSFLKDKWAYWRPDFPFSYYFVAQNFDSQYASERTLGQIFGFFSLLAIIIASLGLFGLASFTAQQRIKEIGIRKALGASVSQIVMLLSKRFTLLVILSIVLATPIAWYAMNNWLDTFAYRIDVPGFTFVWAGGIALMIAWATISYQSVKAAQVNPVESLKNE